MKARGLRVALRADASLAMGLGHVRRCLSLAAALQHAGAEVCLVSRQLGVETEGLARSAAVRQMTLVEPLSTRRSEDKVPHAAWGGVDWRTDADETVGRLAAWRPDVVVVDTYALDARWHRLVAAGLAARIAVIDDLADRELRADVLIDQNLSVSHRDKYLGKLPMDSKLLGGPRFALLGPEYAHSSPFAVAPEARSIGVFMGGTDADDLSSIVLSACRDHMGFTGPIELVTTRANPHHAKLQTLVRKWPATTLSVDLPDLAAFFRRHDVQIGAGGGAAWERCCIGAPTLMLVAASNQQAVVPGIVELGAAVALSSPASPTAPAVSEALRPLLDRSSLALREQLSARSRALVDGLGARRVALMLCAATLGVRAATAKDARMMHAWRNHPSTRSLSHDSSEIAWDVHLDWLQRTLADPGRCLLVGQVGKIDVGVLRFDMATRTEARVSLYLDPALHGLGLGRRLLLAGESHLARRHGGLRFVASVLEDNAGSRRLFQACGYRLQDGLWNKRQDAPCSEREESI